MDMYESTGKMRDLLVNLIEKGLSHKITKTVANSNNDGKRCFFLSPLTVDFEKQLIANDEYTTKIVGDYFYISSDDSNDIFIFPNDYKFSILVSRFFSNLTINKTFIYLSCIGFVLTAIWLHMVGNYLGSHHAGMLFPEIINDTSVSYIFYTVFLPMLVLLYMIFFILYMNVLVDKIFKNNCYKNNKLTFVLFMWVVIPELIISLCIYFFAIDYDYAAGFLIGVCGSILVAIISGFVKKKYLKDDVSYGDIFYLYLFILIISSILTFKFISIQTDRHVINWLSLVSVSLSPVMVYIASFTLYFLNDLKFRIRNSKGENTSTFKVWLTFSIFTIIFSVTIGTLFKLRFMDLVSSSNIGEYSQTLYYGNGLEKYLSHYICTNSNKKGKHSNNKNACFISSTLEGNRFIDAWVVAQSQKTIVLATGQNAKL